MARKIWNWRRDDWPHFSYVAEDLADFEVRFAKEIGTAIGVLRHTSAEDRANFLVDVLSEEAWSSSAIENEVLDRASIQSSIRNNLGLATAPRRSSPAEFGIAELMTDVYQNFAAPLTHEGLFEWHRMITNGRRDLTDIGRYRTHEDAMQVVSGRLDRPTVHFEAPPSAQVPTEMNRFVDWFNDGPSHLPLARAGLAHLYFVCIHPFEDGNGRIARALAEKSLGRSIGAAGLFSLSKIIEPNRKAYYDSLEANNKNLAVTEWLVYFAEVVLKAQQNTLRSIEFLVQKAKFYDQFDSKLNDRQRKVIQRLFAAGPTGFEGGLSAKNYVRIAKTSASTATRDLQYLADAGILKRTGSLKSTRYRLPFGADG